MRPHLLIIFLGILLSHFAFAQQPFINDVDSEQKPWTDKDFKNDPAAFQFAIITDRTGGHRAGVFGKAIEKLNLLQPEFVMCVGDLIEGYTKDSLEVNRQWDEFNSILSDLQMRFFYLPGNHDISNSMMHNQWIDRYGKSYYHFKYGDVLFLAFDTNDGDGVLFSKEQVDYFKKAIQENSDVRWTLLFMHHPIWNYREFNGFQEIENLLKDRPYTVYAGHNHRYMHTQRQERNYYILATTGGGSRLLGPKFGQYDHITWVTMSSEGPKMINLQLEGMLNHDISNPETAAMAKSLMNAANFEFVVLNSTTSSSKFQKGSVYLNIDNTADVPILFKGQFYHNHQLNPENKEIDYSIPAGSSQLITLEVEAIKENLDTAQIDPLELDWIMAYQTAKLETPFELNGTTPIPIHFEPRGIEFTERNVFFEEHSVEINQPFEELLIKYTLNGDDPTFQSKSYETPILLKQTTTIKTCYFSKDGKAKSSIYAKEYVKVAPKKAITKIKKDKAGLKYQYFEGEFSQLPNFEQLAPKKSGIATDFIVDELAMRIDHYAILYKGLIEVPSTGIYTFYVRSDDGSKLFIGDELVINNDGSHSARTKKGYIALEKGKHPIRLEYFEDFLGEELRLYYQLQGTERAEVPFTMLSHRKE